MAFVIHGAPYSSCLVLELALVPHGTYDEPQNLIPQTRTLQSQGGCRSPMKIEIHKPEIAHPCSTPYGIIDKHFSASAKLNKGDDFHIEYEVEVVTSEMAGKRPLGIFITRLTIVMDPKSRQGVTTTLLRDVQVKQLLEATIHQAIYPGSRKSQMEKFSNEVNVTPKQLRAAQIIMDNPGESHAQLLMDEFDITEGSARNLKTRVMKLGLIPNPYVEPGPVSFKEMSDDGDYIRRVLEGELDGSVSPEQYRTLQKRKQSKRKAPNEKQKK